MNIRNEIKAYIVREGFTMSELVEKLAEQYGRWPALRVSAKKNPSCAVLFVDFTWIEIHKTKRGPATWQAPCNGLCAFFLTWAW